MIRLQPGSLWLGIISLCLLLSSAAGQQKVQQNWFLIRPPNNPDYFLPDVDTTSPTPLPRIPPSPYTIPGVSICPVADGVPYAVNAMPGTPYIITPFSDQFRQPPELSPSGTVCRSGDLNPQHCMKVYEIEMRAFQARPWDNAIPGCRAQAQGTWFMGYNGITPGPTLRNAVGHEALVRFTNNINVPYFAITQDPCIGARTGRATSVHAHGSASLAPYDGWAEDRTCLGESKEYIYPNQRATTAWYHDHSLHITLENAYHGLAGFMLLSDKIKDGGCGEPFNLEDIEERVLMLRDAVLTPDCQLYYDYPGPHNRNLFGDINTINGVPFPEMPLEPKWYRFRLLNSAVSRPFLVKIKDEFGRDVHHQICKVIAADGGYRTESIPFPPEGVQMGIAERYEVACNFAPYAGRRLYLWNGNNPAMFKDVVYFCHSHLLALITVGTTTSVPNPPAFDERLIPANPMFIQKVLTPADIAAARALIAQDLPTRTMRFERRGGEWVINGQTWTSQTIAASDVGQNTWELWKITTGGGWFHPVHVHMVDFYILQRGLVQDGLFAFERNAPKDMLFLGPSQDLWVLVRFGAHRGNYMFHCHNLVHEDHDMMRAYVTVGGAGLDNLPVLNPSTVLSVNQAAGVIYNNNELNSAMAATAAAKPTALWPAYTPAYWQTVVDRNAYRIFYPQANDIPGLQADQNPWYSKVCQTLSVFPVVG